jgi:hypothetical protein
MPARTYLWKPGARRRRRHPIRAGRAVMWRRYGPAGAGRAVVPRVASCLARCRSRRCRRAAFAVLGKEARARAKPAPIAHQPLFVQASNACSVARARRIRASGTAWMPRARCTAATWWTPPASRMVRSTRATCAESAAAQASAFAWTSLPMRPRHRVPGRAARTTPPVWPSAIVNARSGPDWAPPATPRKPVRPAPRAFRAAACPGHP